MTFLWLIDAINNQNFKNKTIKTIAMGIYHYRDNSSYNHSPILKCKLQAGGNKTQTALLSNCSNKSFDGG